MAPDGTDVQQLTNDPAAAPLVAEVLARHDADRVRRGDGQRRQLPRAHERRRQRTRGASPRATTSLEFPAWTRDGALIYFAGISTTRNNIDIYSVDPETARRRSSSRRTAPTSARTSAATAARMTYASMAPGETNNVDLFAREAPFDSEHRHRRRPAPHRRPRLRRLQQRLARRRLVRLPLAPRRQHRAVPDGPRRRERAPPHLHPDSKRTSPTGSGRRCRAETLSF